MSLQLLITAQAKGIDNICFLSREGLFFKKIFDIINTTKIKGHYLYVSRISLYPLSFTEVNERTIDELIFFIKTHVQKPVSINQILKMLKIQYPATDIIKSCGIKENRLFNLSNEHHIDLLKNVLLDKRIRDAFLQAKQEYTAVFKKYLEGLDFFAADTVMLADIGWSGSMQTYLQKILEENGYTQKIEGFYFSYDRFLEMYKSKNNYFSSRKRGYFQFSSDAENSKQDESDVVNRIPLEFFTSANHGTVVSYEEISGMVQPVFITHKKEMYQHYRYITPIQEQIFLFIQRFKGILSLLSDVYGEKEVYRYNLEKCAHFFKHPDKKIAEFNSHLILFDDFFGKHREVKFHQVIWWNEAYALMMKKYKLKRIKKIRKKYINKLNKLKSKILFFVWKKLTGSKIRSLKTRLTKEYKYTPVTPDLYENTGISFIYISVFDSSDTVKIAWLSRQLLKQNGRGKKIILCSGNGVELVTCIDYNQYEIKSLLPAALTEVLLQHDYIVTIESETQLERNFELLTAGAIHNGKTPDLVYYDNDTIINYGHFGKPLFKPDWTKEYFLEYDYIKTVCAVRTAIIVERAGMLIDAYTKFGTRGMLLNCLEKIKNVYHVPSIEYHSAEKRVCGHTSLVNNYLHRVGDSAMALKDGKERNVILYNKKNYGKVSIIIPFRDKVKLLKHCVNSILSKTDYLNYEIILVNNQSKENKTLKYLSSLAHNAVKILDFDQPFNYSEINNFAVSQTDGDYVLFLNNDTRVLNSDWLLRMLEQASKSDVGCVGAKLFYPDGRIQHAGVVFDFSSIYPAVHVFHKERGKSDGYMNRLKTVQQYSAVTAACMLLRRDAFLSVSGFDKDFKVAYNDLDLCCRLNEKGFRIIWTPHARLVHYENASRGNPSESTLDHFERDKFRNKWAPFFQAGDMYYSPRLDLFGNIRY